MISMKRAVERLAAVPLALALMAACSASPPPPDLASATSAPDAASVAGEWDVVSFEGYRPQRLSETARAAFADFGPDAVALRIECNHSGRAGTVRDGRFVPGDNRQSVQTLIGCGAEREARDTRYFSFFEKSPTIERVGPDRLRLRADGSELILERPAVRRLSFVPSAAQLQGRWRMMEITHFMPAGGYTGTGLSELPGRIVVSGDRIGHSGCPQHGVTFRLGGNGRLEKVGEAGVPARLGDCRDLGEPASSPDMPTAADALRLLHENPEVERSGEESVVLSTDRLALRLTKAR